MSKAPSTDKKVQELMNSYADWFLDEKKLKEGKMTSDLYPYDTMFSPIQINRMTVKNRLVMAPMGNISMCDETGRPNEKMIAYFTERAKGGVGLITTGLVPVTHGIDNSITELDKLTYFPRIDRSRTVFAGWRDLAANCHSYGSRIFLQATAGLGRVGNPQCLVTQFKLRFGFVEQKLVYARGSVPSSFRPQNQEDYQEHRSGGRRRKGDEP